MVMTGLVPAIHVFLGPLSVQETWMALPQCQTSAAIRPTSAITALRFAAGIDGVSQ
jgi:hypothetical protein